jgi:hypothetical protein
MNLEQNKMKPYSIDTIKNEDLENRTKASDSIKYRNFVYLFTKQLLDKEEIEITNRLITSSQDCEDINLKNLLDRAYHLIKAKENGDLFSYC